MAAAFAENDFSANTAALLICFHNQILNHHLIDPDTVLFIELDKTLDGSWSEAGPRSICL